jgi:hypothetical protein
LRLLRLLRLPCPLTVKIGNGLKLENAAKG